MDWAFAKSDMPAPIPAVRRGVIRGTKRGRTGPDRAFSANAPCVNSRDLQAVSEPARAALLHTREVAGSKVRNPLSRPVEKCSTCAASVADAAPYLSKSAANRHARYAVSRVAFHTDSAVSYRVSSTRDCLRWSGSRVSCAFVITLDDGMECTNTIFVRRHADGTIRDRFPYDPHCDY